METCKVKVAQKFSQEHDKIEDKLFEQKKGIRQKHHAALLSPKVQKNCTEQITKACVLPVCCSALCK